VLRDVVNDRLTRDAGVAALVSEVRPHDFTSPVYQLFLADRTEIRFLSGRILGANRLPVFPVSDRDLEVGVEFKVLGKFRIFL
jgi:hypothetical protein